MSDAGRSRVTGRRPSGFRLVEGFVDPDRQAEIVDWIDANVCWSKRRQGPLPSSEEYPFDRPIPAWAAELGERLVDAGWFAEPPGHVLLRLYELGRGVTPHIDRTMYGPVVAGLTLASSRVMQLTRPGRRSRLEALLLPGDLYLLTGPARYRWHHSIPWRAIDELDGTAYERTEGFSVTFRAAPATRVSR
jgi:alkylated DNA repair dioxygenase AlkB